MALYNCIFWIIRFGSVKIPIKSVKMDYDYNIFWFSSFFLYLCQLNLSEQNKTYNS